MRFDLPVPRACLLLAAALAWAPAGGVESAPATLRAGGGQAADVDDAIAPSLIELTAEVRPLFAAVLVEARLTFATLRPLTEVRLFLRRDLQLDGVEDAAGIPLTYRQRRDRIFVSTPALAEGATTTWTFRYRIRLPAPLEETGQILRTEPWYPHLRHPSDPEEYPRYVAMRSRLTVTLPEPWVVAGAGSRARRTSDAAVTYEWRDRVPSPAIPLVIRRFAERERRTRGLTFRGFFDPAHASQLDSYVDYVADAVVFFSDRFGPLPRPDYGLVGVELPQTISGMTVAGLTFLQSVAVGPDADFPHRILAHEIAHHWWNYGLQIPRRRDGWLREGLPTYSALMFLEHQFGTAMMRQELERTRRVALTPTAAEPLDRGFEMASPEAIYAMNYHKAAFVLHMLRGIVGREPFEQILGAIQRLDADLTTDVFIAEAEKVHGDDLSWFFASWLRSAAVPSFALRYSVRERRGAAIPVFEIDGEIEQLGADIRHPVLVRVPLEGAPPFEQTIWVEPGTTAFSFRVPSEPLGFEFDPANDLLHNGAVVEQTAAIAASAAPGTRSSPALPR